MGLVNRPNGIALSRVNQSQAKFKSAVGGYLLQSWVNLIIVLPDLIAAKVMDAEEQQRVIGILADTEDCILHLINRISRFSVTTDNTNASATSTDVTALSFKLHDIKLPKFGGEITKWEAFGGIFDALVNSHTDLCNVVKLMCLLSNIVDESKELMKGLSVSDDNYKVAVTQLKDRYGSEGKCMQIVPRKFHAIPNPRLNLAELLALKAQYTHKFLW